MATQWYAAIDGDPKGPLTLSELKGWVWQGKVDAETFVRQGAGGEWAAAGTIAELFPDGSHATPPDPAATLEPYTETHAIERLNRRIAAVFSLLAVLCGLAGAIMVVIFLVLNSYSWVAAASFLLYLLAWTVPGGALGAMVGYLKRRRELAPCWADSSARSASSRRWRSTIGRIAATVAGPWRTWRKPVPIVMRSCMTR